MGRDLEKKRSPLRPPPPKKREAIELGIWGIEIPKSEEQKAKWCSSIPAVCKEAEIDCFYLMWILSEGLKKQQHESL